MTLQNYGTRDLVGDADLQTLFRNDFLHQLCIVKIYGKEPPNNDGNLIKANIFCQSVGPSFHWGSTVIDAKFF